MDRLIDTKSKSVIRALKAQFVRRGIPDCLITDNGPRFVSDKFRKLTKDWQFQQITSMQSWVSAIQREKAENTVKTVKRLMRKAYKSGSDPWLSLLAFWNTPTEAVVSSPAQCLFSRRTKT